MSRPEPGTWEQMPRAILPHLGRLTGLELRVYVWVVVSSERQPDGSRVTAATLGAMGHLGSANRTWLALRRLEGLGLLERASVVRPGPSPVYRWRVTYGAICPSGADDAGPESPPMREEIGQESPPVADETAPESPPVLEETGVESPPVAVRVSSRGGTSLLPQGIPHSIYQTHRPDRQSQTAAVGAAGGVRASLIAAGVGEPALSRLAAMPGLTAEAVADAWAAIRAAGGAVGLLITRLPELAAQATAAAAMAAQRAETIRAQEAQRAAERAAAEQAAAERVRIIDDLERAGELDAYAAEAERRTPAMIARPWRGRPTRECGRGEAVARLWRSGWRPAAALRIAAV